MDAVKRLAEICRDTGVRRLEYREEAGLHIVLEMRDDVGYNLTKSEPSPGPATPIPQPEPVSDDNLDIAYHSSV